MRQGALALLLALLLTACTTTEARAPQQSPVPPVPPAPAPQQPAVDLEGLRVEPDLGVVVTRATKVYTGPGPWYLYVRDVEAGEKLAYVSARDGWIRVLTPQGENGWLASADATITDRRGQGLSYRVRSGQWHLQAENGVTLEVTRPGSGIIRVSLSGLRDAEPELVVQQGKAVALLAPVPGGVTAAADIGEGGVGRVSLSERGLLIELDGAPYHQVLEKGPGKAVLEFRPGISGLTRSGAGWQIAYRGDLRPVLRTEETGLVLDLPGALRPTGDLPAGATVEEVGPEQGAAAPQLASPTAQVPARMPAGGLRLRLQLTAEAHKPFALYRPGPGLLELRFLPPGVTGKTVVLDPGHGGEETGAAGPAGTLEKDVNLAVALKLKPLLEQAGARVIMTRTTDTRVLAPERFQEASTNVERTQLDLAARSALANKNQADLYLSIHANGGPPGDGGTEVFWAVNNLNAAASRKLADLAQAELLTALGLTDRGVKQRPFNVIRMTEAPAVLVELGFMTNWAEEQLLDSAAGQDAAARALLRAVQRYFEGK